MVAATAARCCTLALQVDGLFLGGIQKQIGQCPGQMAERDESPAANVERTQVGESGMCRKGMAGE